MLLMVPVKLVNSIMTELIFMTDAIFQLMHVLIKLRISVTDVLMDILRVPTKDSAGITFQNASIKSMINVTTATMDTVSIQLLKNHALKTFFIALITITPSTTVTPATKLLELIWSASSAQRQTSTLVSNTTLKDAWFVHHSHTSCMKPALLIIRASVWEKSPLVTPTTL